MRRLIAIALLLSVLTACSDGSGEAQMFNEIRKGAGLGGAGAAGSQAPGTGAAKMLQDPEGDLTDNGIEVKASSQTEAENICQDLAAQRSDAWTVVQCLGCRLRTTTTGKYICTMRTEVVQRPTEQQP